jgi:hypothetical protein
MIALTLSSVSRLWTDDSSIPRMGSCEKVISTSPMPVRWQVVAQFTGLTGLCGMTSTSSRG